MDVLLVQPPLENMIKTEVPTIVEEERGLNPPLGLMYVAAYAEKYTNHKIRILDCLAENVSHKTLKEEIKRIKPDIVGIQAMTFTLIDVIKAAKTVKSIDDEIPVVVGGSHAHIFPFETANLPGIDYVVLGEGEIVFADLIENIQNPEKLKKIRGLVFRDGDNVINTGQRELIKDLDPLPFPARHLTPYKRYSSLLAKRSPVTTMITSRGCPYKCKFCDRPHLGKVFRARSAQNVVDEMEACVNMGIKEFLIYDDTFTIRRKRVREICYKILETLLDVSWDVRARVDTVDEELLKLMRKAGCERIHFGIESGNQDILRILGKGITLEEVKKAFQMAKRAGLETLGYIMIGSPGETEAHVHRSINFVKNLGADYVHFSIMTPFPSTAVYMDGVNRSILGSDYWKEFAENPTTDFVPKLWEEYMSRERIIQLVEFAYRSFYSRPSYVFRKLMRVKSLSEFKRKIRAGIKILRGRLV